MVCYRKDEVAATYTQYFHPFLSTWGVVMLVTPQVEIKKVMNEEPQKCMCMPNVLVFLSQPKRTYSV